MQDDRRRSEHVGLFCNARWQIATGPRRFSSVLPLLHPAACRLEYSSFFSQALEDRHFTERTPLSASPAFCLAIRSAGVILSNNTRPKICHGQESQWTENC